jgi:hypothetical protein
MFSALQHREQVTAVSELLNPNQQVHCLLTSTLKPVSSINRQAWVPESTDRNETVWCCIMCSLMPPSLQANELKLDSCPLECLWEVDKLEFKLILKIYTMQGYNLITVGMLDSIKISSSLSYCTPSSISAYPGDSYQLISSSWAEWTCPNSVGYFLLWMSDSWVCWRQ